MLKIAALAILVGLVSWAGHAADRALGGRGGPLKAERGMPNAAGEANKPSTTGRAPPPAGALPPEIEGRVPLFPGLSPWSAPIEQRQSPALLTPKPGRRLSADELRQSLRSRGFRDLSDVRVKGDTYVVKAVGPRGERVTLVVNAATSEIMGSRVRRE